MRFRTSRLHVHVGPVGDGCGAFLIKLNRTFLTKLNGAFFTKVHMTIGSANIGPAFNALSSAAITVSKSIFRLIVCHSFLWMLAANALSTRSPC